MQSALEVKAVDAAAPLQRHYTLIVSECQSEECEQIPVYGIRISDGEECAELLDISSDRELAEKLLRKVRHAGVAPDRAILLELAEDYLEELHGSFVRKD